MYICTSLHCPLPPFPTLPSLPHFSTLPSPPHFPTLPSPPFPTLPSLHCLPSHLVCPGVLQYLHQGGKTRFDLVPVILSRVEQIRQWLESQRQYRLYATSLLFVYEGDVQNDEDPMAIDVRMVDFAHTVECATSCLDENFLFGVDRVAAFFQSIGDRK